MYGSESDGCGIKTERAGLCAVKNCAERAVGIPDIRYIKIIHGLYLSEVNKLFELR